MDENPPVVDISSDEDLGFDAATGGPGDDNLDWINELIEQMEGHVSNNTDNFDKGGVADDDDDVVVIREVLSRPNTTRNSSRVDNFDLGNDHDDDCVVLDGDPDKPKSLHQDTGQGQGQDQGLDGESDDLVIVEEKGQVACRDFAHPRHLCVKFPFSDTLHIDHCNKCHCFVCDSPAPCDDWGTGMSLGDHCHAFDKDEFWKNERKRIKVAKTAPFLEPTNASLGDRARDSINQVQVPIHTLAQKSPPIQIPLLNPYCGLPNIISQARSQRPVSVWTRSHRYHPHFVSQHSRNSHKSLRRQRGTNIDLQSVSSSPLLKRHQTIGTSLVVGNKSGHCSYNNVNHVYLKHSLDLQVAPNQVEINPTGSSVACPHGDLGSAIFMGPDLDPVPPQVLVPQYCQQPTTPQTAEMPYYSVANTTPMHPSTLISQEHLAGNSQLQGTVHGQETLPTTHENPSSHGSVNVVGSLDIEFDGVFQNQTVRLSDQQDGYPSFCTDCPTPVTASVDTSSLYLDPETPWSGLAQS